MATKLQDGNTPCLAATPSEPRPTVLVFDSGVGGLSVYDEIRHLLPDLHYIYAFDNVAFPYGEKSEAFIVERVVAIVTAVQMISFTLSSTPPYRFTSLIEVFTSRVVLSSSTCLSIIITAAQCPIRQPRRVLLRGFHRFCDTFSSALWAVFVVFFAFTAFTASSVFPAGFPFFPVFFSAAAFAAVFAFALLLLAAPVSGFV